MAAIFAGILHGLDNPLPLQEEVEGNGLEQEGCRSRSARAMRCGSLCKTIICASGSASVSATFITPVKMMNYCSLSVLSQKPKSSGC
jgi:gamma-glutamylputrescine synthase